MKKYLGMVCLLLCLGYEAGSYASVSQSNWWAFYSEPFVIQNHSTDWLRIILTLDYTVTAPVKVSNCSGEEKQLKRNQVLICRLKYYENLTIINMQQDGQASAFGTYKIKNI